jgi:hypothetical protein
VIGDASPDRNHFAVRGRVVVHPPEIATARDDRTVAHDDRAERKVALAGLLDGHAHEAFILGCVGTRELRTRGRRQCRSRRRPRKSAQPHNDGAPAWMNRQAVRSTVGIAMHQSLRWTSLMVRFQIGSLF